MKNSLREWDYQVAPVLRRMEELGYQISTRVLEINGLINRLQSRPEWLTKAEHEMEQAAHLLEIHHGTISNALLKLQEAIAAYRRKDVGSE